MGRHTREDAHNVRRSNEEVKNEAQRVKAVDPKAQGEPGTEATRPIWNAKHAKP